MPNEELNSSRTRLIKKRLQPVVKTILQRVNNENASSIKKVQAGAVFGPTLYVRISLVGREHRALMDTGSNVNILSEEAYKQYSPKMELRPFHEQVLSATNDPFRILGMFTGCLMFETGVK